jgi:Alw26I/Eco31I/Esp3I family type II restriction m6 adenine DNA methyltransferase
MFCADLDREAIDIAKMAIPLYLNCKHNVDVRINENNFYVGNVLFDFDNGNLLKKDLKNIFRVKEGFDIVLTNPPYKLLKENSDKYPEEFSDQAMIPAKKLVEYIQQNRIYKYNEGTLNYYKIFTEEIITNYTNDDSRVGLLIPVTLLNDKQSEKLRRKIFENYEVFKIYIIPEQNSFFPDICQAFCFFTFNKATKGKFLEINPSCSTIKDFKNESFKVDLKKIKQVSESMPVIIEEKEGWRILEKISKHNKLRYFSSIYNLRGELDLTLDKEYITNQKTNFPLLKGNNISEYKFDLGALYVKEEFLQKLNGKRKYLNLERLACQQISNIHSKKRLKFTKIPPQVVLGNSCNFVSIDHNLLDFTDISLDYMLGLFNSLLLDWRFRITNSNNHVSNYEISELPIAIPSLDQKKKIESLVKSDRQIMDIEYNAKLNLAVFELYQIEEKEILYILDKYGYSELTKNIKSNLNNAL